MCTALNFDDDNDEVISIHGAGDVGDNMDEWVNAATELACRCMKMGAPSRRCRAWRLLYYWLRTGARPTVKLL